jgi:hypothetical protein
MDLKIQTLPSEMLSPRQAIIISGVELHTAQHCLYETDQLNERKKEQQQPKLLDLFGPSCSL